jgi:metallo-beta-lactamase family protein
LLETSSKKILIDCGLFQGSRELRDKNWQAPAFDPAGIDAVVLTHAHIDHTGLLPRYHSLGLKCPVYATVGTYDLCQILLPDSGRLQEEEASYRASAGRSRHNPPLPLYTEADAREVLARFIAVEFDKVHEIVAGVEVKWRRAGHILGAAFLEIKVGGKLVTISGDIGRYNQPVLANPEAPRLGDVLLLESTYGGRNHPEDDPGEKLAKIVTRTALRGGTVVIPSFAVGRAQQLLYYFWLLKKRREIPDIPVVVDSPMAVDASELYLKHSCELSQEVTSLIKANSHPFCPGRVYFSRTREESRALNKIAEPMIIISASGMLTGGRILHHLKHRISSPLNTVIFVGYQPPGGRGSWITAGNSSLTLFKEEVHIRADIEVLSGLSAHADSSELMRWCKSSTDFPRSVALVHGEPTQTEALKAKIESELGWDVQCPKLGAEILL